MKTYYTHDNGGRPFKVTISGKIVNIYVRNKVKEGYSKKPKMTFSCKKIFIGKSPSMTMTKVSGGIGKEFDGNSLLFEVDNGRENDKKYHEKLYKYIFVGDIVYSFTTFSKIVEFVSPVGNNDVPYPYAINENKSYLLLIEYKIIFYNIHNKEFQKSIKENIHPYSYYYDYEIGDINNMDLLIKRQ